MLVCAHANRHSIYRYKRPPRRPLAEVLMGMALVDRGMDGVLACGGTGARPQPKRETLMEKHLFVGFTNPVEGEEDAFNAWYSDVHLKDVLKVPGIVAAQRFKLSDVQRDKPPFPWRYLALYEIETDWFFQPITSKLEG